MGQNGMGRDGTRLPPMPGTSSRSEVHLVEAAGNVKSFACDAGLSSGSIPHATLVPRPWGWALEDPSGWCVPTPSLWGRLGLGLWLLRWS